MNKVWISVANALEARPIVEMIPPRKTVNLWLMLLIMQLAIGPIQEETDMLYINVHCTYFVLGMLAIYPSSMRTYCGYGWTDEVISGKMSVC